MKVKESNTMPFRDLCRDFDIIPTSRQERKYKGKRGKLYKLSNGLPMDSPRRRG